LWCAQYPPVTEQVKKRCRWLLTFANGPLAAASADTASEGELFGGATVDANALGWALAAVSSRAFRRAAPAGAACLAILCCAFASHLAVPMCRVRGTGAPASMLPLIDICNHSFEPNVEVKPAAGGALALRALQPLQPGAPLLLSYGPLSNDFLLMDYGTGLMQRSYHDNGAS
jgi:histone-lysine N-methyltransferase SETD3